MALEAMMIILDNSEPARNGDFFPTRLEAQKDAALLLSNMMMRSNGENAIGVMTMGGSPEVLISPTQSVDSIAATMHSISIKGKVNMSTCTQIAQLVLKHRQNKNQHQRMVIFVGSPLEDEESELYKLAKRLKKNNIAVDVINFGETELNGPKLQKFINTVNSNDNSHLLTANVSGTTLTDFITNSSVFFNGSSSGAYNTDNGFEFGVDPNLDPELALALRLSVEEARSRQEADNASANNQASDAVSSQPLATSIDNMDLDNDDENNEQIREAIALSLQGLSNNTSESRENQQEQNDFSTTTPNNHPE